MISKIPPLFLALMATLCFAYASTIFTEFARKTTPFWMNSFKAFVAFFAFLITLILFDSWTLTSMHSMIALISSGCIGLMIGDIFMLHAMKDLGASRMLMFFGLQPFFLGIGAYFLFDQKFSWLNFLGVIFMVCCLYTISLEGFKKNGTWHFKGLVYGLIAILLDAIGVLMTRYGFNESQGISSVQVNAIRCFGAILGFLVINFFYNKKKDQITLNPTWNNLSKAEKVKLFIGSLGGTYFSLMLYLTAVSKGQLSVISSVSVTGPMFASAFECVRSRKWPSKYLLIAFIFFICGFAIFSQL